MEIHIINFPAHGDTRGMLVSIEEQIDIPFEIKRVYYVYDTNIGVVRGKHAHRNLKQVLVSVHGSCTIKLDNGYETKEVLLNDPKKGLLVDNFMWREMYDFSEGAVLLVLASELYDENDYIRDYDQFIEYVEKNRNGNRDSSVYSKQGE